MRFTCNRQQLADMLTLLAEAVPSRTPHPILQNILLEAPDPEDGMPVGRIKLSATDQEIGIRHWLETTQLEPGGKALLPAQRLTAIVREDRSNEITVSISDYVAKIQTDKFKYTLIGQPGDAFPALPDMPGEGHFEIAGDDVAEAGAKTIFAAARAGDSRYALNGVLVSVAADRCEFVASDTHRLSCVTKRVRNADGVEADGIVLTKGFLALERMAARRETVALCLTGKHLMAWTSDAFLAVRLVEGQFPRYKEVIPQNLDRRISVNREEFAMRLRNLGVMANEESRIIVMESMGEDCLVVSTGSEAGDGRTEMEAVIKGGDIKVAYDYLYLLELLKAIPSEDTVTFQLREGDVPSRVDCGDLVHVLVPRRQG